LAAPSAEDDEREAQRVLSERLAAQPYQREATTVTAGGGDDGVTPNRSFSVRPVLMNSRDDTIEARVGKWALRQFLVIPIVVLALWGIAAIVQPLFAHH
jgi:hypothetical protein